MSGFSHFNAVGEAVMVDVTEKQETEREAIARGRIRMSAECASKVQGRLPWERGMCWVLPGLPELWAQKRHRN